LLFLIWSGSSRAQETLDEKEVRQAIALGRSCHAPIIRVAASRGDFDVYVESPFARVALVAATALMMYEPLDAPGVIHGHQLTRLTVLATNRTAWKHLSAESEPLGFIAGLR
jgi:hypothetical protein